MPLPDDWRESGGWPEVSPATYAADEDVVRLLVYHGVLTPDLLVALMRNWSRPDPVPHIPARLANGRIAPDIPQMLRELRRLGEEGRAERLSSRDDVNDWWGRVDPWQATQSESDDAARYLKMDVEGRAWRQKRESPLWRHIVGVNRYCVAAYLQTGGSLGPFDWQHEPAIKKPTGRKYPLARHRADALLTFDTPWGTVRHLLELDRGTRPVHDLVNKQCLYRDVAGYGDAEDLPAPALVWCFDDGSYHLANRQRDLRERDEAALARAYKFASRLPEPMTRNQQQRDEDTMITTLTRAERWGVGVPLSVVRENRRVRASDVRSLWPSTD